MNAQGILTRNLDQYKIIHKEKVYGCTSERRVNFLEKFVRNLGPATVLDYGCGQNTATQALAKKLKFTLYRFDPAVEGLEIIPEPALAGVDLIISTHVLEHLDPKEVLDVLSHMRSLSQNALIIVPTTKARQMLSNGENAHATVQPASWWRDQIALFYQTVQQVPAEGKTEIAFVTWEVPAEPTINNARRVRRTRPARIPSGATVGVNIPSNSMSRLNVTKRNPIRFSAHGGLAKPIPSVRGKRVAIVGKAGSIIGSGEGKLIDSYDIVVRVNQKLPLDPKLHPDMGSRTDILYTNHGISSTIQAAVKAQIATEKYNKEYRGRLSQRGGYTPFTGTVCIFQMLDRGASEVYVTGMDLYSGDAVTPSAKNGRLKLSNKNSYAYHDPNGDKDMLRKLLESDPRFKPSPKLLECITQDSPLIHYKDKSR